MGFMKAQEKMMHIDVEYIIAKELITSNNDMVGASYVQQENNEISTSNKEEFEIARQLVVPREKMMNNYCSQQEKEEFSCDRCNSLYKSQSILKHHIRNFHEGVRYECEDCVYETIEKHLLKRHK